MCPGRRSSRGTGCAMAPVTVQGRIGPGSYRAEDISDENLRALVQDSRVDDTHGIDRAKLGASEPLLARFGARQSPVSCQARGRFKTRMPSSTTCCAGCRSWRLPCCWCVLHNRFLRVSSDDARMLSLIVTGALLNLFILRDPVDARVGGMAGPVAVLCAWMAKRVLEVREQVLRRALTLVMVSLLGLTSGASQRRMSGRGDSRARL